MNNLLEGLNERQIDSILATNVPLRIIAGAGSGKTRVITTKIAHLIEEEKISPKRILAVTFTNKAANEMKERVEKLAKNVKVPYIMTFHAFCVRVLREDYIHADLTVNFQIIDTDDQLKIIRQGLKDINAYDPKTREEKQIISRISNWKSRYVDPEEAFKEAMTLPQQRYAKVYRYYLEHLKNNDKVDFDDLILKVHNIFSTNTKIRNKWISRFDYIMVDEFQDTNYPQFDLIKWLVDGRNCLTVVGDPDQNIYSWRGAKLNIILEFEQNFKNAQTIMLTQNYRSTKNILDIANKFIEKNKNRVEKDIFTVNGEGEKPQVKEVNSKKFEGKFVANEIKDLIKSGKYKYSDIYILYRTNAWSVEFEKELTNASIPFALIGAFRFLDRKEIKDMIALLKMITFQDNASFERVFKFIPKIGELTAQKLFDGAAMQGVNLFTFLVDFKDHVNAITKNLTSFSVMLVEAKKLYDNNDGVAKLAEFLYINSGLKAKLKVNEKENDEAIKNIAAFLDQMNSFDESYSEENKEISRVNLFLQETSLNTSTSGEVETPNKVTLMTIHSAKGLENKVVFIAGLNKDVFPSKMSLTSISGLEEERRTFYVAITRAQEKLYISYVIGERSYISGGELGPSRFIEELDPSLYEIERNIFFHTGNLKTSQKFDNGYIEVKNEKLDSGVKVGDVITHNLFGDGIVDKVLHRFLIVAFINKAYGIKSVPINSETWKKIN